MIKKSLYNKNIIPESTSVFNILKIFNSSNIPTCFIINKQKEFIGTITDGDIRRAILQNKNLSISVKHVMNKKPKFLKYENKDNFKFAKNLMLNNKIRFLPIIKEKKIFDILDYTEFYEIHENPKNAVVIMAGGRGERLMPLTKNIPKPLIKINSKPILLTLIENLKNEGFSNFYIIVNYLANKIINEIGNGKKLGIKIKYIKENKELGTLGGVSLIKERFENDFILINGDIIGNFKIKEMLEAHKNLKSFATIGTINQKYEIPYGVIDNNEEKFIKITEKPTFYHQVSSGIYILNKSTNKLIKKNKKIDVPDFLNFFKNKKIKLYPLFENWIDVGTKKNLETARKNTY
jgi:dTDP-glucose pyrophosphorylase/predicted transcriptional regulator